MTRDEYLHWRTNVAVSNEAKDSIVELMDGRTFKIRHQPMAGGGWVAPMRTSPSSAVEARANTWRTTMR